MDTLYYTHPAENWSQALPLGNGTEGVMIYGSLQKEILSFNNGTLWSGFVNCDDKENGYQQLEKVRKLIFSGKNHQADLLAEEKLFGGWSTTFLPLGDLCLDFEGLSTENYKRTLDMANALHNVSAVGVQSEAFASFPSQVVVYKIRAKKPFNITITAKSLLESHVIVDDGLNLLGQAPDKIIPLNHGDKDTVQYTKHQGMAFCLRTEVQTDGETQYHSESLSILHAKEVILYCKTATGFLAFDQMPETDCGVVLRQCKEGFKTLSKDYDDLKQEHIKDFANLYHKQTLSLKVEDNATTDQIIAKARNGGELAVLSQLIYNYGKYLLISGSRKGGQPLNLQGLWNHLVRPPWSSNYTTNINTEMNYWGASACGLSECIEPLLRMLEESLITGHHTAKEVYGADGFCCNHNMDIWRKTSPSKGSARFILAPLCGAWLTNELYKHYQNGELDAYRERIFHIVEENAKFLLSFLVLHNRKYVICPSHSPENAFRYKFSVCSLDYATAFDMAITRQSLTYAKECCKDPAMQAKIEEVLAKLYPLKKSRYGIREYHKDYIEFEPGHRHFSHLYAFYPSDEIGYYSDPKRTNWIRKSFWRRLNYSHQHIGWSAAWAMCIGARLRDVPAEQKVIRHFITNAIFPNLFCFHQPSHFQIDGNFGFIAGLNEMLLTEEQGKIELLPAILPEYKNGSMQNLRVKGVKVSFEWANGKVTHIESDKPIEVYNKNLSDAVVLGKNVSLCS